MEEVMRPTTSTAFAALILGFALCTQAIAQDQVRVFEEAPSLDQLRAILVPDAGPGQSRKIEFPPRESANPITTTSAPTAAPAPIAASPQPPAPVQAAVADHTVQAAGAVAMPK